MPSVIVRVTPVEDVVVDVDGASYREIAEQHESVSKDKARRICDRRDEYEAVRDRTAPAAE